MNRKKNRSIFDDGSDQDAQPVDEGGLTLEQQLQMALDAQVDDDFEEEGTAELDIPDYNNVNDVIPQTLQKVNEDEEENNSFENTMKSGTMQKLIKTPASKSKKSKMAVTPQK